MADPLSSGPDIVDLDGLQRPPTFVQIRPPPAPVAVGRWVAATVLGIALAAVLGWTSYRLTIELNVPRVAQGTSTRGETPAPQPDPVDLSPELAMVTIDTAVSSPAWSRASLMDWVEPFNPSAGGGAVDAAASQAAPSASDTAPEELYEMSVRLGKGETIGSALQKRGFAADSVAEAVAALAPHVSLKRLPIGLVMTLRVRPAEEGTGRPVLQALTLQPDARLKVTVARDGEGNYAVERR